MAQTSRITSMLAAVIIQTHCAQCVWIMTAASILVIREVWAIEAAKFLRQEAALVYGNRTIIGAVKEFCPRQTVGEIID